jgi:dTDP-4-dehydrorhamnose reductase
MPALRGAGAEAIGLGAHEGAGVDRVVDITDPRAVTATMADCRPDVVIHAAAYTDVDGCERDPARAFAVNADGSRYVAEAATQVGAYCLAIGTDFVFSGRSGAPYAEDAEPDPISVYGASKLAGERAVLATDPSFAVARTAWVWGGTGKHFPRTVLTVLRDRGEMEVVQDEVGNPTHAEDLAEALIRLATLHGAGIFHLTNEGTVSRYAFARAIAAAAGLDPETVRPTTSDAFRQKYPQPARRPADSSLRNSRAAARGIDLQPWPETLREYIPGTAAELGWAQALR